MLNVIENSQFKIESLGIQELDVYDIEVDSNHNFFANDILVHNSIFLTLSPVVDLYYKNLPTEKVIDIIEKISKDKITPIINGYCKDLQTYTNAYRDTINFKIENICDTGISIAKKRYALNVYSSEGITYATPQMKIMGIEVVKSSTPKVIRDVLKQCISIVLNDGEQKLQDYILQVREEFKTYSIEQISFPRGVNGIKKYSNSTSLYSSGCPIHTKGAILFNHKIKELKLTNKYKLISDGDNVKFCYLKLPNPIKDKVMAFHTDLPKEFQLEQFIDYEMQFEKSFLAPLKSILDVINWNIEKKFSVSDFF